MSGGVNRGLAFLRDQQQKSGGGNRSTMNQYWPNNNERAEFWFLNDGDTMFSALVHGKDMPGKNGRKGWTADVLCGRDDYDDPKDKCKLCTAREAGDQSIKGPWWRTGALIWMKRVVYLSKPTKEIPDLKPLRRAGSDAPVYEQVVEQVRVFLMKDRVATQATDIFLGVTGADVLDEGASEGPKLNLMDQPFTVERSGEKANVIEVLKPLLGKKGQVPPEVVELRQNAAEQLVTVMQEKFGQGGRPKTETTEGSGRADIGDEDLGPIEDEPPIEAFDGSEAELVTF